MTPRMQSDSHPNNIDPQRIHESMIRMEMPGEDLDVEFGLTNCPLTSEYYNTYVPRH